MNWKSVTRGMDGITQIPAPAIAGQTLSGESQFYYLLLGVIAIFAVGYRRLLRSTYGRAFTAVRDGELAANVLGVNIARLKVLAFGLSALFAGTAGGLYAHLFSVISPDVFSFEGVSVPILLSLFIGGSGAVAGALVGSGVVVLLPEVLRIVGQWYLAVYGMGILMLMVFMPEGIAGRVRRVWQERGLRHNAAATKTLGRHAPGDGLRLARNGRHGDGLSVEHLTKRFGGLLAVNDVSFIIQPGDIKSIIGPNGAGKTTLLNLVTGVYRPDAGSVFFEGRSLLDSPVHGIARRGILRTFQNARVWRDLSVLDNVMVSLHGEHRVSLLGVLGGSRRAARIEDEMRERAEEALDFVGLGASAALPAASLPYGHLRLLEVARCLVARPKLILLDEPAAGLNAQEVAFLKDRLQAVRRLGAAVLVIEHNMVFVMSISDQVIVISNGRKIAEASPGEVQRDAAVIEAYLGEDVDLAAR
jgi:branched-chain amino acid transport system permease protein